jgi:hypothetical protein
MKPKETTKVTKFTPKGEDFISVILGLNTPPNAKTLASNKDAESDKGKT